MPPLLAAKIPMTAEANRALAPEELWLWHGYLAAGTVTLLTSQWKTGKTTLITGFLSALGTGEPFLGHAVRRGRGLYVSEESQDQWSERLQLLPVGPHVDLLARPFRGRPSPEQWQVLIDEAAAERQAGRLDLVVIDPLASFLPVRSESDAMTILEGLEPLRQLAAAGLAVLLLHHPRKKPSDEGSSARGSGALLGFVDIVLELSRSGKLPSDTCRRQLVSLSRKLATPARLAFEWDPATGRFTSLEDPLKQQFEDNWKRVARLLEDRGEAATHLELFNEWPDDVRDRPSPRVLYDWLRRAYDEDRVRREGKGTKTDPYRYRLPNENDAYHDRGELPPLPELEDIRFSFSTKKKRKKAG